MAENISEIPCRTCGAHRLYLTDGLTAQPISQHALAGAMLQIGPQTTPQLRCRACRSHGAATISPKDDGSGRVTISVDQWSTPGKDT